MLHNDIEHELVVCSWLLPLHIQVIMAPTPRVD